jgi:hypothetical protein
MTVMANDGPSFGSVDLLTFPSRYHDMMALLARATTARSSTCHRQASQAISIFGIFA